MNQHQRRVADPPRLPYGIPTPTRTERLMKVNFHSDSVSGENKVKESSFVRLFQEADNEPSRPRLLRLTFGPCAP